VSDVLFWSTLLLLTASTIWTIRHIHGMINAPVLVAVAWIVLIAIPIALRPQNAAGGLFPEGFIGAPRDNMYVSIALANVGFTGFQWVVLSPWFKFLQHRVVAFFGSAKRESAGGDDPLTQKWVLGLVIIAIGLAVLHMALMPRVPAWDLVVGFSDPLQPNYDREAADKFLPVPTLVRYVFDWNQGILFPILFAVTVLMRWRPAAVVVGVFGFIYVTCTLEKFPSLLFLASPVIAIAVRDSRPIWSRLVIGGLALSLIGPLAVNQAPLISTSIHQTLHLVPPASATPAYDPSITTPVPGCETANTPVVRNDPFSWRYLPLYMANLLTRRIGSLPAEVTYGWFAYFPAQHPFLNGYGWEPWKVLAPGFRNPANLVGLWMYCGHDFTLPTVSAYGSFVADGWAEFGYVGVVIVCLGIVLFGLLLELMRGFASKTFCVGCYGPAILLFATLPPRAGLLATIISSGLWLVPVLCALFLVSESFGRRRMSQAVLEPAGS
jgi:hypothetical protein